MATFYMTADAEMYHCGLGYSDELYHYGVLGMKWGVRRYQNKDGTLTSAGKIRYGSTGGRKLSASEKYELKSGKKQLRKIRSTGLNIQVNMDDADKKYAKAKKQYDRERSSGSVSGKTEKAFMEAYNRKDFYKKGHEKFVREADKLYNSLIDKYGTTRVKDYPMKTIGMGKRFTEEYGGITAAAIAGQKLAGIPGSIAAGMMYVAGTKAMRKAIGKSYGKKLERDFEDAYGFKITDDPSTMKSYNKNSNNEFHKRRKAYYW